MQLGGEPEQRRRRDAALLRSSVRASLLYPSLGRLLDPVDREKNRGYSKNAASITTERPQSRRISLTLELRRAVDLCSTNFIFEQDRS